MTRLARVSAGRLVARILDQPELVSVVQALEAAVLRRLVEHVGLEDAGEVVALATTEQLGQLFDEDLWRSQAPGRDESFDAERFALWLEVLLEADEEQAIEKLALMDEDLLALGLSRLVLVIDIDALALALAEDRSDERDLLEKALEGQLHEELEEYRVIARNPAAWDSVLTLLVGLDKNHHALVQRVLAHCCAVSGEYIEDNGGLYEVLTADEMLESDVAFEREQRREREGFVAPSQAAAFLRLARATPEGEMLGARGPDPVTKAHFRAAPAAPGVAPRPSPKVLAFVRELRAAGVLPRAPGGPRLGTSVDFPLLRRALGVLGDEEARRVDARRSEMAYLVNVIMAVCGADERELRPIDALGAVSAVCELGLTRMLGADGVSEERLRSELEGHGLVKAFRVGWGLVGDERWTAEGVRAVAERASMLTRGSGPVAE